MLYLGQLFNFHGLVDLKDKIKNSTIYVMKIFLTAKHVQKE